MRSTAFNGMRTAARLVRSRLALGTALAGSLVAMMPSALAQSAPAPVTQLPNLNNVGTSTPGVVVSGGGGSSTPDRLNIAFANDRSVVNWTHFNIPAANQQANFRYTGPSAEAAILNRVVGFAGNPTASSIMGKINAAPNVEVWLINPAGIMVGATGAINTGGFIASTLAIADGSFASGALGGDRSFVLSGASNFGVTVAGGGSIRTNGGALLLVAPKIAVDGTLNAAKAGERGGDVALVAARNARFTFAPNSPLSVLITEGTEIAAPMVVKGTINGSNVYFAVATPANMIDTLLVDANVTASTAFADDHGIVFAAGAAAPGVRFGNTAAVGGQVGITANGPYRTIGSATDPDITLRASLGVNAGATMTSAGMIDIGTTARSILSTGFMRADDEVVLTSDNAITIGDVRAASFRATAPNGISLGSIVASTDILVDGGSIVVDSARAIGERLAMTAATGGIRLDTGAAGTTMTLTADTAGTGALVLGDLASTGKLTVHGDRLAGGSFAAGAAIDIQIASNATLESAVSRTASVRVGGSAVKLDSARAATTLTLAATGGDVTVTTAGIAGGKARVTATGNARLAALTSTSGSIDIAAGGALLGAGTAPAATLRAAATVGNVMVTTGGAARAETFVAGRGIAVTAGSIDIGSATAGTTLGLTATAALKLGGGSSGTATTLMAGGAVSLPGSLKVGGNLTITGSAVTLGVDPGLAAGDAGFAESITANGRILVTSTAGAITGGAGLALISDANANGGEPLLLRAAGGNVAFDAASAIGRAGSAIGIQVDAGRDVTLGRVTAARLTGTNGTLALLPTLATSGAITLAGPTKLGNALAIVSNGGPVSLGDVTIANAGQGISVSTQGGGGAISGGPLSAKGGISLLAGATASAGSIVSDLGAVTVQGTTVTLGDVKAGTTLSLTATNGNLMLGTGAAGKDATLNATRAVRVGRLVTSDGDIAIGAAAGVTGLTASDRATLIAGGTGSDLAVAGGTLARLGTVTASDSVTIAGTLVDATSLTASGGALTVTGGDILLGGGKAGTMATVTASGDVDASTLTTTNGAIMVAAGGAISGDSWSSGGAGSALAATGDDIVLGSAKAGGALALEAIAGGIRLDRGQSRAGTTLSATGAVTTTRLVTAAGAIAIAAGDAIVGNDWLAGGAFGLDASGDSVTIGSAKAGTTLDLTAKAGAITIANGRSGTAMTLDATGAIMATRLATTAGAIDLDAGGAITGDSWTAGGAALGATGARITIGSARAGTALTLKADVGDIAIANGQAGTTATLNASGAANATRLTTINGSIAVTAGGAITGSAWTANGAAAMLAATGESIALGTARSATTLALTATTGDIGLADGQAGAAITLSAADALAATRLATTAGPIVLAAGGAITGTGWSAGAGALTANGDSVSVDTVNAGTTLGLTATAGGITALTARSGGAATIKASGAVEVQILQTIAGAIDVTAGTTIAGDAWSAGGAGSALTATGDGIDLGSAKAAGALDLSATAGDVRLDHGHSGGVTTIDATGAIVATRLTSIAGAIDLAAGGAITGESWTAGGAALRATGARVSIGSAKAGTALALRATAGSVTLTSGQAGTTATLDASDAVAATTLTTANGSVAVTAGGSITGGAWTANGATAAIGASGDSIALDSAKAAATLDLRATAGDIGLANGQSGGATTLVATGAIAATRLTTPAGAIDISGGGAVTGESWTARGGGLSASGARVTIGTAKAGGALDLEAIAGDIMLANGQAGTTATLVASGAVNAASLTTAGGSIAATAGGSVTGTAWQANGAGAALTARGARITIGSAQAAAALGLTAVAGDIALTSGVAGGNATLAASGGAHAGSLATANGGDIAITAGDAITGGSWVATGAGASITATGDAVTIGTAQAAATLGLTANAGDIRLSIGEAGGAATLRASGAVSAVRLATTNGDIGVIAGTTISGNDWSAGGATSRLTASARDIVLNRAASGAAATLTAGRSAAVDTLTTSNGAITITASTGVTATTLTAGGATSSVTVDGGTSATIDTVTAGDGVSVTAQRVMLGDATATAGDLSVTGGTLGVGTATVGDALSITASQDLTLGTATVGGEGLLTAGGTARVIGDLRAGTATPGAGLTIRGRSVLLGGIDPAAVTISATGGVGIVSTGGTIGGGSNLTVQSNADGIGSEALILDATGGDIIFSPASTLLGGTARQSDVDVVVRTAGSDVALGTVVARGLLGAPDAQAPGTLATAGDIAIKSIDVIAPLSLSTTNGNIIVATALKSGSNVTLLAGGGSIAVRNVSAGAIASLDASANVTVDGGLTAGTTVAITAGQTATLDAVTLTGTSGTSLAIKAADADIRQTQKASTITITHNGTATADFVFGDAPPAANAARFGTSGQFALSDAEFDRLGSDTLTLVAGAHDVTFGTLSLGDAVARGAFDLRTTGNIVVLGNVEANALQSARTVIFGGAGSGRAASLTLFATPAGDGGALLLGNANLGLNAARIAAGQKAGFLDDVGALDGSAIGLNIGLLSNARSTLYNATGQDRNGQRSGTAYVGDVKLVAAGNLTIDFTEYALFQNTGAPGVNSGVDVVGTTASPGTLKLSGDGDALGANVFALFGTINGVADIETALLGNPPLDVGANDRAATRINGCLVGGGGCIVTVISQPTVNVFDASRVDILKTPDKLQLQFDPLVGTNNESLFTGVGAIDTAMEPGECAKRDKDGNCAPSEGDQ